MSATLQIIAVIKTLGVITLKDHSLAPVSQGTKVMDTIVQVKFFDECLKNSHNCSENATCTNMEGSFNCSCKPGYVGNGHSCSGWFLEFLSCFPLVLILLGNEIVTRSFYNNFIYSFKYYLITYSNLTSQSSRIVDNDSEFISIYLHNAENQGGVTFNPLFCTTMGA
ncbi:unnamed protein product [Porites evermanni]|uniref:EGF-like domain-containing protein n=1 Tax=Porites evermanni TaxID=104178 RepID=A0ABN8QVI2_9CNID|nr:unnamed protein product [Porites evermanni]